MRWEERWDSFRENLLEDLPIFGDRQWRRCFVTCQAQDGSLEACFRGECIATCGNYEPDDRVELSLNEEDKAAQTLRTGRQTPSA